MNLFPFFQDLTGRHIVLVGGGHVAREKLEKLLMFTENISVIAEDTSVVDAFLRERGSTAVRVRNKTFEDFDLADADVVIGATDDRDLNRHISGLCKEHKVPVNIVDDAELCTFIFPSLVKRGDLVVGITTAGKSPAFGQHVRRTLERALPEDTEAIIDELYALKLELKATVPEQKERARQLRARLAELLAEEDPS